MSASSALDLRIPPGGYAFEGAVPEAESAVADAAALPRFTVCGRLGALVSLEFSPIRFSTGGIEFITNGHRTPGSARLIPDRQPRIATAEAMLQVNTSAPWVFRNIAFGISQTQARGICLPDELAAHQINGRLLIPKGMEVDDNGRPLEQEAPQFSVRAILGVGREQHGLRGRMYPDFPITQARALDDVLRSSPRIQRETAVDPKVVKARQTAAAPSTIDPAALYKMVVANIRTDRSLTIADELSARLESGNNPLGAHYRAALKLLVSEWDRQDKSRAAEIQAGRAAIRYERGYLKALLQHRREMRDALARLSMGNGGEQQRFTAVYSHY